MQKVSQFLTVKRAAKFKCEKRDSPVAPKLASDNLGRGVVKISIHGGQIWTLKTKLYQTVMSSGFQIDEFGKFSTPLDTLNFSSKRF